jgi:hypothetical protein
MIDYIWSVMRTVHTGHPLRLAFLSTLLVLLFSCSKEDVTGPCGADQEANGGVKVLTTGPVGEVDPGRTVQGTGHRGMELDGDGLPDDDGISDDGNDEGDSERNRKVKN